MWLDIGEKILITLWIGDTLPATGTAKQQNSKTAEQQNGRMIE